MLLRSAVVLSLAVATLALSQDEQSWVEIHRQDEAKWAEQTGLSPFTVQQLWRLASHFADAADDDSRILFLDAGRLGRNHIVLVTYAGSDYCLGVTVFAKTRGYQKIWAEDQTPEGEGFCGAGAKVSVNDGRIVISTPSKPDRVEGEQSEFTEYSYEWNGKTYRFSGKWKMYGPVKSR
jgi:hypothetical protein